VSCLTTIKKKSKLLKFEEHNIRNENSKNRNMSSLKNKKYIWNKYLFKIISK
jgi:SUMO ligase MMS21 Smc5/6 complex component